MKLAGWLFEKAHIIVPLFLVLCIALMVGVMLQSRHPENMSKNKFKLALKAERDESYRQGWKDGFNAFINRPVTTDNVSFKIEEDVAKYFEEVEE